MVIVHQKINKWAKIKKLLPVPFLVPQGQVTFSLQASDETTASSYCMGGFFNVFDDCGPIKWIYTIIFGQIFKLTFGETIHVVTLLSRSTILKKLNRKIPIIAQCLRFASNIESVTFLFLTAQRISQGFCTKLFCTYISTNDFICFNVVIYQRQKIILKYFQVK